MNLYPVMINLHDRQAVMIGGGEVALRKTSDLLYSGAHVKVVSPEFHSDFALLEADSQGCLQLVKRKYRPGDLQGAMLVFSATNDPAVNREVFEEATELNILINAVDDPPNCSFYIPSMYRKGDLIMTLSTSGASPSMAARLRRTLEEHIPEDIDVILTALREARELLKESSSFSQLDFNQRGALLKDIVNREDLLEGLCESCKEERLKEFLKSRVCEE